MIVSSFTTALYFVVICSATTAAAMGLFRKRDGSPYSFSSLRGQTVEIFGQGLDRYGTSFFGAGSKGQGAVVLFLGVPFTRGEMIGPVAGFVVLGLLAFLLLAALLTDVSKLA